MKTISTDKLKKATGGYPGEYADYRAARYEAYRDARHEAWAEGFGPGPGPGWGPGPGYGYRYAYWRRGW